MEDIIVRYMDGASKLERMVLGSIWLAARTFP